MNNSSACTKLSNLTFEGESGIFEHQFPIYGNVWLNNGVQNINSDYESVALLIKPSSSIFMISNQEF